MTDFSDRPFIAGTLTGIRSFRVTPDNTLTGVHRRELWASGVNKARCVAAQDPRPALARWLDGFAFQEPSEHRVGQVNCTCGFYAYFDTDANPHHHWSNILGLVEGYGTVTVGSRGFRASKARIVALIQPDPAVLWRHDCDCWACAEIARSWDAANAAAFAANYPGVRVFPTVVEALAEYPLTPAEQPKAAEPPERYGYWAQPRFST